MRRPVRGVFGAGRAARFLVGALLLAAVAAVVPSSPVHAAPGRWFWVQKSTGWQHVYADLVAQRTHVLVFAPPGAVSLRDAGIIASAFESRIYPTDTRLFGTPRALWPIDLLLTPLDGITLGYFDQNDLVWPGSDRSYSNLANVLYVRTPAAMPDPNRLADVEEVAAHELQHLIDFRLRVIDRNEKPQEDWLNEGLSFYAQLAAGYFTPRDRLKIQAAAAEPAWQVTGLRQSTRSLLLHGRVAYGCAGLFMTYLATRYGPNFVRRLMTDRRTGMQAIDALLRPRSSAAQAFADWSVASYLDQPGVYGFGRFSPLIHAAPLSTRSAITAFPYDSDRSAPLWLGQWARAYLRFAASRRRDLHLTVQAPPSRIRAALIVQSAGGPSVQWLQFDATGTASVQLHGFGRTYSAATLAIGDVFPAAGRDHIDVRARLVHARDNYGAP